MMNTKETDLFIPTTMSTVVLLGVGGVANRPIAIGNHVEVRPSVYISLIIDQRVWHPLNASELSKEFRWIMEHPDELEKQDCQ